MAGAKPTTCRPTVWWCWITSAGLESGNGPRFAEPRRREWSNWASRPNRPHGEYSCAHAVSADGSLVVGQRWLASGLEAFRWTELGDVIGLGFLSTSDAWNSRFAVSADGSLVLGSSDWRAFLWDDAQGMHDLDEKLPAGVVDLQGGVLTSAKEVPIDARTTVMAGEA